MKIRGIGLPFDSQYSSCSNIKPTEFDWSAEEGEYDVHIDQGLLLQPDQELLIRLGATTPKEKRFGWICESRFIVPHVYSLVYLNHKELFETHYTKIFTSDKMLLDLDSRFVYCPNGSNYPWVPKSDWKLYDKTKLCSMFCSPKLMTDGHAYRHQIARLALDSGFDVFGGAHGTPRTIIDPQNPWNTKIDGLKDYMFSIVIENGNYDTYYTEKLTDCFTTGTIPVYWGTKKILDIFDTNGIIFLEEGKEQEVIESLTSELYASKFEAVKNNFDILSTLRIADDVLFDTITINETVNS